MKQINATLFRLTFLALAEPIEVTHHGKVIGEWSPRLGVDTLAEAPVAVAPEDPARAQSSIEPPRAQAVRRPKPVDLTKKA